MPKSLGMKRLTVADASAARMRFSCASQESSSVTAMVQIAVFIESSDYVGIVGIIDGDDRKV